MSKPVFDKVLIANRGEIACRVMATCKKMGIKTVAVYSTADEQAKHVKMADEAICIGPPTSSESYLRVDRIIDAAVRTKANAVHPGYGFLSENGHFSAELAKNNIVFIGPDAESIEAMGDKIESKRLAKKAGITTIPGYVGEIRNHEELLKFSNEIGYPVMIKASGGGGGKGMRVAYNDKECVEYHDLCKEEAKAAFNNDKMLVEKFIEQPRHIEVQVICDRRGNALWLPERECSIQRRNQKVIEEAPSVLLDHKTRVAMGEEAVALARAVKYVSAGTVENVVNRQRQFYFLEMNTRLQVEHPITELITGVDLVEQMILAAAGLPLSITQDDIKIHGHATEARVYAEDPMKNYFPSIGRLNQYEEPVGDGIRVDSGILEGSQISVYYDPLIAKLSAWGKDRAESITRLEKALDQYVIRGLKHNVCLLRDVINQSKYQSGDITTNYLTEVYPHGFKKAQLSNEERELLYYTSAVVRLIRDSSLDVTGSPGVAKYIVSLAKEMNEPSEVLVTKVPGSETTYDVRRGPGSPCKRLTVVWRRDFPVIRVFDGDQERVLQFWSTNEVSYGIQINGTTFDVNVMSPLQAALMPFVPEVATSVNAKQVLSPMPGVIVHINVNVGDSVVAGSELVTLEAMKMRNKIRAEVDGKIKSIKVATGATVEDSEVLIEFE